MNYVNLTCGNCGEKNPFGIRNTFIKSGRGRYSVPINIYYGHGLCINCGFPVLYIFSLRKDDTAKFESTVDGDYNWTNKISIMNQFPKTPDLFEHSSIPDNINNKYNAALKNHINKIDPDVVISTCRGVLELICNNLNAPGEKLFNKIENLFNENKITDTLYEWATIIRKFGNKSVHEMNGTWDDASELIEFTKIFLEYVYILPAKIAENKKKLEDNDSKTDTEKKD